MSLTNKNRPAVILIESEEDVTVCFITSQIQWQEQYDILINPSENNGLKKPSLIRLSKLATIDKDLIIGRLGNLDVQAISQMNRNLIHLLQLV